MRRKPVPEAVSPPERADQLLAPFRSDGASDPSLFARLLPGPRPEEPGDVISDPIQELELASDIDNRTFDVSELILKGHPAQSFLAIYIGGLDSVQHAFWQYRFPEDFPGTSPARHDIERLSHVPDRYVRYLDERLNQLLGLYAREPNVIIMSDHGFGPTVSSALWRGWHAKEGIFLAAGPSIPRRREPVAVSYYDIVPTIARLKGLREPERAAGKSLVSAPEPE